MSVEWWVSHSCVIYRPTSKTSNNSFAYYGTSEAEFKNGLITIQNRSNTLNAWMRLNYQNMCW